MMRMMRSGGAAVLTTALAVVLAACSNPSNGVTSSKSSGGGGESSSSRIVGRVTKDPKIAAMLPSDIAKKGSLTASINTDIAPIKYLDRNGKIVGLNPDLLRAAAKVLGITISFQQSSFDAQVPGLEAHRFDIIASAGDFVERQKRIDWIDYMQAGTAILALRTFKRGAVTPQNLCGLSIGYGRGSAQQSLLATAQKACTAAHKSGTDLSSYADDNTGVLAVRSGQVTLFWGDLSFLAFNVVSKPDQFKIVYKQINSNYAVGVSKDDPKLRDALRAALTHLVKTGMYAKLLTSWGQSAYGTPTLPVNSNFHLAS